MVFDIDFHGEKNKKNKDKFRYRRDKVINTFGTPHLIFRTPSSGLHLYYLLNDFYSINEIRLKVSQFVKLSPGLIELFPGKQGLRLFGGKGCALLNSVNFDEITRDPKFILKESINALKLNGALIDSSGSIIHERPLDLSRIEKKNENGVNRVASPHLRAEIENLLANGLQAPGTRNEALLRLNWYLQTYLNKTSEEAEKIMIEWIRKKNNGLSKDWKKNPKSVIKQIGVIARGYDASKINWTKYFPVESLSKENLETIEIISKRISEKYLEINRFKLEAFLQDLASYCKGKHHNFEVPIPKKVFQKCRYGSENRYVQFLKVLTETRVLTQKVSYSADAHRCRVFKIFSDLVIEKTEQIYCVQSEHIISINGLKRIKNSEKNVNNFDI